MKTAHELSIDRDRIRAQVEKDIADFNAGEPSLGRYFSEAIVMPLGLILTIALASLRAEREFAFWRAVIMVALGCVATWGVTYSVLKNPKK